MIERKTITSSDGKRQYVLGRNTITGEMYCTCQGYRHRRRCKHIKEGEAK